MRTCRAKYFYCDFLLNGMYVFWQYGWLYLASLLQLSYSAVPPTSFSSAEIFKIFWRRIFLPFLYTFFFISSPWIISFIIYIGDPIGFRVVMSLLDFFIDYFQMIIVYIYDIIPSENKYDILCIYNICMYLSPMFLNILSNNCHNLEH